MFGGIVGDSRCLKGENMKFKGKHILVYGLGDSGRSVAKILKEEGAIVSLFGDDLKYLEYVGFERNPFQKFFDLVVLSPGIKVRGNKLLEHFENQGIPVISEIDFGYMLAKGKIIAITGTNGKTTTCMLTYKILKEAGYKTFLCGNIGLPFSSIAQKTTKKSVVVCEVSNFQLESSKYFRANVSAVLNLTPDHLDRHGSFEEYQRVKSLIAKNIKSKDVIIVNFDDENTRNMFLFKNIEFFSKKTLKKGVFCKNNQIFINKKSVLSLQMIKLKGEKNLENVLASIAICKHFHVKVQDYEKAISEFVPAAHRMEIVGERNGITFVDDSKATNLASTMACVEAFKDENKILLMGGLGKEIEYDALFSQKPKLKKLVCFGSDGQKIFDCAKSFGLDCEIFEKFEDAVKFSKEISAEGDFVLLSPACASFDEFSSYAERGDRFKEIVLEESL